MVRYDINVIYGCLKDPDSMCVMTINISSWLKVFHDNETHSFILIHYVSRFYGHETICLMLIHSVSRCFITMKQCLNLMHRVMVQAASWRWNQLVFCWLVLIQHVSSLLHHSDSLCFLLRSTCFVAASQEETVMFHANSTCFNAVSPVGTSP